MRLFFLIICSSLSSISFSQNKHTQSWSAQSSDLFFIENKGQITDLNGAPCPELLFIVRAQGVNIFIGKNSLHYIFSKSVESELPAKFSNNTEEQDVTTAYVTQNINMYLVGANKTPTVKTGLPTGYYENYYNIPNVRTGVDHANSFKKVTIENLYNNIDWVLYFKDDKLKYDFIVHEGADLSVIKMKYEGANELKLLDDGSLCVKNNLGKVIEEKPFSYMKSSGTEVAVKYLLNEVENSVSFMLNTPIKKEGLVIDPGIIWSTFYGGNKNEGFYAICSDTADRIIGTGYTQSSNNISYNAFQDTISGAADCMIVKFDSAGNRLWATYFGATGTEAGNAVCTDKWGYIYVAGSTKDSYGMEYNGYQAKSLSPYEDAFLIKLNPFGVREWSTYYGARLLERAYSVATDSKCNVYLSGETTSYDSISFLGHQNSYGGSVDAFLVKFDSAGNHKWGTYYGGSSNENHSVIAIDKLDNVYMTGSTNSTNNISFNGYQNNYFGNQDVYLVKFNPDGVRLWGSYYGGTNKEEGSSICIDNSNAICVVGWTTSLSGIYKNGFKSTFEGITDIFLAKFDSSSTQIWGTYFGTSDREVPTSVSVDNLNNIYFTGWTYSKRGLGNYAYQDTSKSLNHGSNEDAVLAMYNSNGGRVWSTYFGGNFLDVAYGTATDKLGNVYLCGETISSNLPVNRHKIVKDAYSDGFITKFDSKRLYISGITPQQLCSGDSLSIHLKNTLRLHYGDTLKFQLSDTAGYFDTVTLKDLYTVTDTNSYFRTITFLLPDSLYPSTNYKIRLISLYPADTTNYNKRITIYNKPKTSFYLDSNSQCGLKNIRFNNNSNVLFGTIVQHKWDFGDSTFSDSTSPQKKYNNVGSYIVKLKSISDKGCIDSVYKSISISDSLKVGLSINKNLSCEKDTFIFQGTSIINSSSLNYNWNFGDSTSSDSALQIKTYNNAGVYNVKLRVTTDNNCSDTASQYITVAPLPLANFSYQTTLCNVKDSFSPNNLSSISNGSLTYFWNFGDSTFSTLELPRKNYSDTGEFLITLLVKSDKSCKDSVSKILTIKPSPTSIINIVSNNTCSGDTAVLEANNYDPSEKVFWITNNVFYPNDTVPIYKSVSSTVVKLVLQNLSGCRDTSSAVTVSFNALPQPIITQNKHTLDVGTGYSSYQWYGDGQILNGEKTNAYNVTQNGNYYCVVTDSNTCMGYSDTVSIINVSTKSITDKVFKVYPNPNYGLFSLDFYGLINKNISLTIMNALGQIIYTQNTDEKSVEINLKQFPKGFYILTIKSTEEIFATKILIE